MRIVRSRPTVEWTQVPNAVARDHRLSWRARGLLLELLSFPPGWETSIDALVKQAARESGGTTEGRDAMRAAARELVKVGYLVKRRRQDERGRWHTDVELTDAPMWELIHTQMELPDPSGEDDRRRDSRRRPDQGQQDVSSGRTDDGIPGVGSPGVGSPGVIPKIVPKLETPDPEESEAAHAEDKPAPAPAVVEVSAETLRQAAEIASRLDLARLDAKPKQVIQITQALAEALTHPAADPATLQRYAAATVATGHKVKYLLNGLSPERLTIGLPAYRAGEANAPAEACPIHLTTVRRTNGECPGCWTDRTLADAAAQECTPGEPLPMVEAMALMRTRTAAARQRRKES